MLWFQFKIKNKIDLIQQSNTITWITLYEIINIQKFLDKDISKYITSFLLIIKNFIFIIYDKKIYILIIYSYICFKNNNKYINNIFSKYSLMRESFKSQFGPYYYFDSYDNIFNNNITNNISNNKTTIRFIIFLNKYKYLLYSIYITIIFGITMILSYIINMI